MEPRRRSHFVGSVSAALLLAALSLPAPPLHGEVLGRPVAFEDAELHAKQKELLTRYAEAVARWAMVQRVVQTVAAQNAQPQEMARIEAIDQAWQKGEDPDGLASALMRNECSQALQALLAANPGYGEAFVTDAQGAIACMSGRTTDYYQGDEPKWSRALTEGMGTIYIGAAHRDESTGLEMVHISVPVVQKGKAIGVLVVGKILGGG